MVEGGEACRWVLRHGNVHQLAHPVSYQLSRPTFGRRVESNGAARSPRRARRGSPSSLLHDLPHPRPLRRRSLHRLFSRLRTSTTSSPSRRITPSRTSLRSRHGTTIVGRSSSFESCQVVEREKRRSGLLDGVGEGEEEDVEGRGMGLWVEFRVAHDGVADGEQGVFCSSTWGTCFDTDVSVSCAQMSGSPITEHALEEVNRLALRDLEAHNEVIVHQQGNDFWYAAKTADMPLSCQARLAVVRSAQKHQSTLGGESAGELVNSTTRADVWCFTTGLLATILGALWLRLQLAGRRAENEKVRKLVQTVLNELRKQVRCGCSTRVLSLTDDSFLSQEHQHHVDPALVPQAYMAQSHLRDLILQHEHSPARRQRLWTKVEKVVEGNANVRASQIEHNGEELRAWEWTGTGGGQIEGSGTVYPSLK